LAKARAGGDKVHPMLMFCAEAPAAPHFPGAAATGGGTACATGLPARRGNAFLILQGI
jgi:hypothetical protein